MDWANALAQGIGAAANTGAQIIGDQMKQQQAIEAEQRAADIKLDTAQRLMAMEEAMRSRAAERFSSVVKVKMGEQLPVDAPTVQETGVTRDSAKVLGQFDYGNGPEDATGIAGSADRIKSLIQTAQATLANPDATDEQRADAQGLIAQLSKQVIAQDELNRKSVEGMTRTRSPIEAGKAALDETLATDPLAYMAGTGMLGTVLKDEAAERQATRKERLAAAEASRKADKDAADRESRERIEGARLEQRERESERRFEALITRLEGKDGKNAQKSAMVQNLEWLRDNLNFTSEQLADYVTEKKRLAPEDIAAKLLSADKYGELTPETAMERAMQLVRARDSLEKTGASSSTVKALPAGAVQIGTAGGKPVYRTPDGKQFIQD